MSNTTNHAGPYATFFKSWAANLLGPKPTAEMFSTVHGLGLRPGKQALANAMALRDKGVTAGQIVIACGAPQLNKMRDLITDAYVKRNMSVPKTPEGHTVYKLELTAKGKAKVERTAKAEQAKAAQGEADKPAKVTKAAKPRKAKVAPVTVDATNEAATVTVNVPEADTAQAATA